MEENTPDNPVATRYRKWLKDTVVPNPAPIQVTTAITKGRRAPPVCEIAPRNRAHARKYTRVTGYCWMKLVALENFPEAYAKVSAFPTIYQLATIKSLFRTDKTKLSVQVTGDKILHIKGQKRKQWLTGIQLFEEIRENYYWNFRVGAMDARFLATDWMMAINTALSRATLVTHAFAPPYPAFRTTMTIGTDYPDVPNAAAGGANRIQMWRDTAPIRAVLTAMVDDMPNMTAGQSATWNGHMQICANAITLRSAYHTGAFPINPPIINIFGIGTRHNIMQPQANRAPAVHLATVVHQAGWAAAHHWRMEAYRCLHELSTAVAAYVPPAVAAAAGALIAGVRDRKELKPLSTFNGENRDEWIDFFTEMVDRAHVQWQKLTDPGEVTAFIFNSMEGKAKRFYRTARGPNILGLGDQRQVTDLVEFELNKVGQVYGSTEVERAATAARKLTTTYQAPRNGKRSEIRVFSDYLADFCDKARVAGYQIPSNAIPNGIVLDMLRAHTFTELRTEVDKASNPSITHPGFKNSEVHWENFINECVMMDRLISRKDPREPKVTKGKRTVNVTRDVTKVTSTNVRNVPEEFLGPISEEGKRAALSAAGRCWECRLPHGGNIRAHNEVAHPGRNERAAENRARRGGNREGLRQNPVPVARKGKGRPKIPTETEADDEESVTDEDA